nr:MAG TPA: hypothetical protein [Caudoviricetes sp.]DAI92655.1 MAG TPA: hypothetical protein [Caudoviricetes sp.]
MRTYSIVPHITTRLQVSQGCILHNHQGCIFLDILWF